MNISNPYTFSTLFDDIDLIVVPRIQRPYAQGRTGETESKIRANFLKALFRALETGTDIDLNFLYGAVKKTVNDGREGRVMELLDGQQRITTLFLLHWYLLNKEHHFDDPESEQILLALASFSYETRTTATEFCRSLAQFKCDLDQEDVTPSSRIISARWYYHAYDKDSTIASMLVMLDAIHQAYLDHKLSNALPNTEHIRFYMLPLEDYGKAEELYMKMNARGLPLSVFDNFKADFISALHKQDSLSSERVPLYGGQPGEEVTHAENIAIKLDTKWIDLFWNSDNLSNHDLAYMHLFSRFFACRFMIDSSLTSKEMRDKDNSLHFFFTQAEKSDDYLDFERFGTELSDHQEYFVHIERILDTLYDHKDLLNKAFTPVWDQDKSGDFFTDSRPSFSQTNLTVMGAIESFILSFDVFDEKHFGQWMRVVHNIVENTDIDNLDRATVTLRYLNQAISFVAHFINSGDDFFVALAKCAQAKPDSGKGEWPRPFVEEFEKARRISEDDAWLTEFEAIECLPFFKGTVCFFYHPGITLVEFKHRCQLVQTMFNGEGITQPFRENHLLIRALLSVFTSWNQLNRQYITEKNEQHKHLKMLLIDNEEIHDLLGKILDSSTNEEDIIKALTEECKKSVNYTGKNEWDLATAIACNTLRQDTGIFDWIADQSQPVYVQERKGHIAVSIPNKWFDRFYIDSHRDQLAEKLMQGWGLKYYEDEENHTSQEDYDKYGHYKGDNVTLYRDFDNEGKYSFNVSFVGNHSIELYAMFSSADEAVECQKAIAGSYMRPDDHPSTVFLDKLRGQNPPTYYTRGDLSEITRRVKEALSIAESHFNSLPK